ncbi:MAG: thiaminase II [Gemmatimonadetes bacterium]|nr:thiaminase II [Gemmatimonadota bacterium]NNK61644.1 thiaminase II [Gemmatimonadota bacterium]
MNDTPLSTHLHRTAVALWDAQLEHPFVRGIADGTLEEERFARWVVQDYLYLKDFARIFAWAVTKADRLESMSWYAEVLHLTLNTEMELHRQYAARFGIAVAELEQAEKWPTTRAYTDFLLRTAADGDALDLLAALLPCSWGYLHIAQRMRQAGPSPDPRYEDWIEMYASDEFAEATEWLKREVDRLGARIPDEKRARVEEIFVVSSRYEWAFWEMCWKGERWLP